MWGQYMTSEKGIENAFEARADDQEIVGPYQCSTCKNGDAGFGYVGNSTTIPKQVSSYTLDSQTYPVPRDDDDNDAVGTCPDLNGTKEEIGCAALQRHCQTRAKGWLIFAQTFDTETGFSMCSGCDKDGYVTGTGEDEGVTLSSGPMLFMYCTIGVVLAVAIYVDIRVFAQNNEKVDMDSPAANSVPKRERTNWFVLHALGYVDEDGNVIDWKKAICTDRVRDLYCCKDKLKFANFLSALLVTLGVSALFGDGARSEYNCYFDATSLSEHSLSHAETTEETYTRQFFQDFYGLKNRPESGIPTVITTDPTQPDFIVGEILAAAYQLSLDLLTRALSRGGYMTEEYCLLMMNILSAAFCASAFAYEWNGLSVDLLFLKWLAGLMVVLILVGPFASGMARLFCVALVSSGCCNLPEQATASEQEEGKPESESGEPQFSRQCDV